MARLHLSGAASSKSIDVQRVGGALDDVVRAVGVPGPVLQKRADAADVQATAEDSPREASVNPGAAPFLLRPPPGP